MIGKNIKNLRKAKGLTQVELAEKLKTTQQAITAYETGKKKPAIDKLPEIAAILNVTIEDIVGRKPLQITQQEKRAHKNSRTVKMQELFDKLNPDDQKSVLKHVKALVG